MVGLGLEGLVGGKSYTPKELKEHMTQRDKQIASGNERADELAKKGPDMDDSVIAKLIVTDAMGVTNNISAWLICTTDFHGEKDKLNDIRLYNIRIEECRKHRVIKAVDAENRISVRDVTWGVWLGRCLEYSLPWGGSMPTAGIWWILSKGVTSLEKNLWLRQSQVIGLVHSGYCTVRSPGKRLRKRYCLEDPRISYQQSKLVEGIRSDTLGDTIFVAGRKVVLSRKLFERFSELHEEDAYRAQLQEQ